MRTILRRGVRPLAPLVLLASLGGCGSHDVTPPAQLARSSVEKALDAWKAGGRPGAIEGTTPPVQVSDSVWQGGRKLASYEILREDGGESDRRFAVRLELKDPPATEEALYIVLGQGPVQVYREEDYRRMVNMEDNPTAKPKRPGR